MTEPDIMGFPTLEEILAKKRERFMREEGKPLIIAILMAYQEFSEEAYRVLYDVGHDDSWSGAATPVIELFEKLK